MTKIFEKILNFRYVLAVAVFFLLLSSFILIIVGAVKGIEGVISFFHTGFQTDENIRPGFKLLDGLDAFMVSLIFMIFGLGIARLFLFNKSEDINVPT